MKRSIQFLIRFSIIISLAFLFSCGGSGGGGGGDGDGGDGVTIPTAPSGLSATAVSSSQINLSWTDNSNNEDGFKIERKTGAGGTYAQIDTVGPGVTTYQNTTGLSASTAYYYQVRAYNGAGDSTYSNEANATTLEPPLPTGLLPDTGQTTCYDTDGNVIDCAGTGQDGEYTINPPSYTDNGDGTVTDNVTGLIWQKCSAGQNNDASCSGTASTYTWQGALDYCNGLSLAGHSDWWLPSKKELMRIVNYGTYSPAIDTTAFPNTVSSYYWSSSTNAVTTADAWYVYFNFGYVSSSDKPGYEYVRCIR